MWKEGENVFFVLILSCFFLLTHPGSGRAAVQSLSDETLSCLGCHSQHGLKVSFQNKESLEAYVETDSFKASVHASLGCTACHPDFSVNAHPKRTFKTKEDFAAKAASVCRQCHTDDMLKARPVHASLLLKESSAPVCTRCHGAHAITAVAGGNTVAGEKQYCLGCHAHELTMVMKNSETAPLKVDPEALNASVHAKLSCSDCHFGFSSAEHPVRNFRSIREFSLASADACRRCHFDKYAKSLDGIHYAVLSQGRLNAPVCTDCHGAHAVARAQGDKVGSAQKCQKCHEAVYSTYVASVHGKALMTQQNADVPVCIDCHSAHSIQDARTMDYRDKVPEICGQCHSNKALMKKYGLYPEVVNSYLDDFHGVTLKLYQKQPKDVRSTMVRRPIATCIDCHGVHDITTTKGPGTNMVKARLVKQCQRCHPGATEEFPDAWLSHYEPTLANAPMVFLINLLYKILIPFMVVGLVLQILLHVWRYTKFR